MSLLEQESANCYRIRRRGNMRVDAVVYLNKALKRSLVKRKRCRATG